MSLFLVGLPSAVTVVNSIDNEGVGLNNSNSLASPESPCLFQRTPCTEVLG